MLKENFNHIMEFLETQGANIKCVSFDVFDTLMHRKIAPPDQVIVPAARAVIQILQSNRISDSLVGCIKVRQRVTQRLKMAASRAGNDPECHIREIITAWLQHYLPYEVAVENWRAVLSEELKAEEAVCLPLQGMKEIVKKIKQSGKRILFLSDMYLGIQEISSLLVAAGYDNLFDAGYVSADIGLNKKSGRLFDYVLEYENISASEMLHVGDDYFADVLAPKKKGIKTLHIEDGEFDNWAYRHRKLYKLCRKDSFWQGARWVDMIPPFSSAYRVSQYDFPYAIGLHLIGPLFANFIHQTIIKILHDRSELVLFPSREGFILKEIYDRIAKNIAKSGLTPSCYIFLSRKSVFLSSIEEIGAREVTRGLSTLSNIKGLLNKFSLDPKGFEQLAEDCGFGHIEEVIVLPRDKIKLQKFIDHPEFKGRFTRKRNSQREILKEYLKQFGFWDVDRTTIVDIGWDGTIQEALSLAFKDQNNLPRIDGYYMALLGRTAYPCAETSKSKLHGIFYDYRFNNDRTGIGRFTELFEASARAPHGTTLGYNKGPDGFVSPVLDESKNATRNSELKDTRFLVSVQAGILDYVDHYINWIPFQDQSPKTHAKFILSQIDRLTRFPTRNEASLFKGLTLIDDFEGTRAMPKASKLFDIIISKNKDNSRKNSIIWPEGDYAAIEFPGMQYLFNVYRAIFKRPF